MAKRKLKLKELFTGRRVFIVRYGAIVPATVLRKASWVTRRKERTHHNLTYFGLGAIHDSRRNMVGRHLGESEYRFRTVTYYTREQMVTLLERGGVVVHVGEDDSGIEDNIFSTREAARRWINKSPSTRGKKILLVSSLMSTEIESSFLVEETENGFRPISNIAYDSSAILEESEEVLIENIELEDKFQEDKYGLIAILNGDKPTPSISDSLRKLGIKKD